MDAAYFDCLTKLLGARASRRVVWTVVAGWVALLGAAPAEAKCKKPCGPCRACKKKKCRPKPDGAGCGACKVCHGGSCENAANGTPCGGGTCQGGQCAAPCAPDCGGGKDCGGDGCGGSCGTCGGNQSCQNGHCVAACVPACTGGRDCNGGQCECPPDRPHSGGLCDDTCRECCINDHCGQFNGKKCDHTQGSICVCANPDNHDCGLMCTTCCVQEHCIPIIGDNSQCVDGGCRCHAGLAPCFDPVSGQDKCTDMRTDENNCGECGRDCPAGSECIGSTCV